MSTLSVSENYYIITNAPTNNMLHYLPWAVLGIFTFVLKPILALLMGNLTTLYNYAHTEVQYNKNWMQKVLECMLKYSAAS